MKSKKRLDLLLIELGLVDSRTRAQELILNGQVSLRKEDQRMILNKPSLQLELEDNKYIEVTNGPINQYVSRGGLKLEGALNKLSLSVNGFQILDIGVSTGGFSDCLLQSGAKEILAIDVGHNQLAKQLQQLKNLKLIEGVNARYLNQNQAFQEAVPKNGFDMIVMDVSFISITLILPELKEYLKDQGIILSLVKPQFEVGIDGVGKNGIVTNLNLYSYVENKIKQCCLKAGLICLDYFESTIEGKDGNKEFFIFLKKK